jgi:DNA polymerase III subunit epsilon
MKSGWSSRQVSDRPPAYDFSLLEATARGVSSAYREQLLDELTFVVFDTETTGLDPAAGDRIISLAGVKVRKRVVRRAETFDALVNPGRRVPAASTKFHGITFEMVAEAPALDAVLPAFLRFPRAPSWSDTKSGSSYGS